jgi:hypothetical protein
MIAFLVARECGYDLPAFANVNIKCHHLFYDDVCNRRMSRELWCLAYADICNVHPSSLCALVDGEQWRMCTIECAHQISFWHGLGATDGDVACLIIYSVKVTVDFRHRPSLFFLSGCPSHSHKRPSLDVWCHHHSVGTL